MRGAGILRSPAWEAEPGMLGRLCFKPCTVNFFAPGQDVFKLLCLEEKNVVCVEGGVGGFAM